MPHSPDDKEPDAMAELILRIAHQDEVAFRALFADMGPKLKTFFIRRGVAPALAEDHVQETAVAIWRKAAQFDPARGSAAAWIYRIARNLWIDVLRREPHPDAVLEGRASAHLDWLSAQDLFAASEREAHLKTALATLPSDQAALFRMSFVDCFSHAEIAERLSIPLGTVKSNLRRIVRRLRAAVESDR